MYLTILTRQILYDMLQSKLRYVLAIFCIAFGTLAVVMLLALGNGFHDASYRNMMDVVDGSFIVWQGKASRSADGFPKGQVSYITVDTLMELPKIFPAVATVSPWNMKSATISYHGKAFSKSLNGVAPEYAALRKITVAPGGRFFSSYDLDHKARVVIIGNKLKQLLFAVQPAVGEKILINTVPFLIIGVLPTADENKHNDFDDAAIISYASYSALFGDNYSPVFIVLPYADADPIQFEQSLRGYFAEKCHFDKNDKEALHFFNTSKIFQFMRWFFVAIQIFLGACGTMTLAVGSIGVANIMFLIVTERTQELGLRKALGATDAHILWQLLIEAMLIVLTGGGIGFITAMVIITVLQHVPLPTWLGAPVFSWGTAVATLAILTTIGIIAGMFPARRAAKLDPIEAIMN